MVFLAQEGPAWRPGCQRAVELLPLVVVVMEVVPLEAGKASQPSSWTAQAWQDGVLGLLCDDVCLHHVLRAWCELLAAEQQ